MTEPGSEVTLRVGRDQRSRTLVHPNSALSRLVGRVVGRDQRSRTLIHQGRPCGNGASRSMSKAKRSGEISAPARSFTRPSLVSGEISAPARSFTRSSVRAR
jgi:hypothetical protein